MTEQSIDQNKLRQELEAIAEYLQTGGTLEEILAQIEALEAPPAAETPPETPPEGETGETEGNEGETPPETPPETATS